MLRKILLYVSIAMLGIASGLVIYALSHPEASFPWSITITHAIYIGYTILMVLLFALSRVMPKKQDKTEE